MAGINMHYKPHDCKWRVDARKSLVFGPRYLRGIDTVWWIYLLQRWVLWIIQWKKHRILADQISLDMLRLSADRFARYTSVLEAINVSEEGQGAPCMKWQDSMKNRNPRSELNY